MSITDNVARRLSFRTFVVGLESAADTAFKVTAAAMLGLAVGGFRINTANSNSGESPVLQQLGRRQRALFICNRC